MAREISKGRKLAEFVAMKAGYRSWV